MNATSAGPDPDSRETGRNGLCSKADFDGLQASTAAWMCASVAITRWPSRILMIGVVMLLHTLSPFGASEASAGAFINEKTLLAPVILASVSDQFLLAAGWTGGIFESVAEKSPVEVWQGVQAWVTHTYHQTPALILGLAAALALPPLAIIGFLVRGLRRAPRSRVDEVPRSVPVSPWRQQAWVEVVADANARFDVVRDLIRIGREGDNDLCLEHPTVHRYHAVLERSPELVFTLIDVSGLGGNGMRVDGQPVDRARLRGGEVVELGNVRLRFHLSAV